MEPRAKNDIPLQVGESPYGGSTRMEPRAKNDIPPVGESHQAGPAQGEHRISTKVTGSIPQYQSEWNYITDENKKFSLLLLSRKGSCWNNRRMPHIMNIIIIIYYSLKHHRSYRNVPYHFGNCRHRVSAVIYHIYRSSLVLLQLHEMFCIV